MDKTLIYSLATFCADQHARFIPGAWLTRHTGSSVLDSLSVATVAKYLSMTSWYGHSEELEAIAVELHPELARKDSFEQTARACEFDPGRFSVALRYRLAMRQIEHSIHVASPDTPVPSFAMRDDRRSVSRD